MTNHLKESLTKNIIDQMRLLCWKKRKIETRIGNLESEIEYLKKRKICGLVEKAQSSLELFQTVEEILNLSLEENEVNRLHSTGKYKVRYKDKRHKSKS